MAGADLLFIMLSLLSIYSIEIEEDIATKYVYFKNM